MQREAPAIIGRRVPLDSVPAAGGGGNVQLAPKTQLISARMDKPRQFVVTMMQPVTQRFGANPWTTTFDGANAYPPVAPLLTTAPTFPVGTSLQLAIRWGAGGCAFETRVDYPAAGGVFGLTADSVDVDVTFRGPNPTYAPVDLPVVGAFAVEGVTADPSPLRWRELDPTGATGFAASVAAGGNNFWAVKPFARRVRMTSPDAVTRVRVEWLDTAGATLWSYNFPLGALVGWDAVVDVPAQATVLRVVNNGAAPMALALEWYIGLT